MALPDPDRPSTWIRFRSGMCSDCFATCCTLPLEVKATDLLRLGLTDETELAGSKKKLTTRLQKAGIVRTYREATGLFLLEQKHGRDCIFLDANRLCTVYDKRPDTCRNFPQIGARAGYCPKLPKRVG